MRRLPGGFELDDDPARIDVDEVYRFVSLESYWARGRSLEVMRAVLQASARVVGLYDRDRQIGFARVVTDGHVVAYLADMYVLPAYRGRGLGVELVRETVENGPYAHLGWLLQTADARTLYERFGFGVPSDRVLERQRG